jgi:hypothetical protein
MPGAMLASCLMIALPSSMGAGLPALAGSAAWPGSLATESMHKTVAAGFSTGSCVSSTTNWKTVLTGGPTTSCIVHPVSPSASLFGNITLRCTLELIMAPPVLANAKRMHLE